MFSNILIHKILFLAFHKKSFLSPHRFHSKAKNIQQSCKTFLQLQLKEITDIARGSAADGANIANLNSPSNSVTAGIPDINTIVNSNRDFINSFAAIDSLDCTNSPTVSDVCNKVRVQIC